MSETRESGSTPHGGPPATSAVERAFGGALWGSRWLALVPVALSLVVATKDRLAKIVMLILAMLFLEFALRLAPGSDLDLLYLALGTTLIAAALLFTQKRGPKG